MGQIQILADNIISPLGWTSDENLEAVVKGKTALRSIKEDSILNFQHISGIISNEEINLRFSKLEAKKQYKRLEKLSILSAIDALTKTSILGNEKDTLFIISTTKGNIDLLETEAHSEDKFLSNYAKNIASYFENPNDPLVISNACISGVVAIITANRLLKMGAFKNIVIIGADQVGAFTLSGFYALKALSQDICRPFDKQRKGINLGEAACTIIMSNNGHGLALKILGGAISNDANHISGPSRTGEGMQSVIKQTLKSYDKTIESISAHGTATLFNDEMEAIALDEQKLADCPVNSLKAYFGHTLGAAGIIESIISYRAMLRGILIKSLGYETQGTTRALNVITKTEEREIRNCLKTASGFGGCNAAILFEKV